MLPDPAITQLLRSWREGDDTAAAELAPLVYDRLRKLAASHLRHEKAGHTLAPTGLVHEAYLRIAGAGIEFQDRQHFFAVASTAMRRVLVDHARRHRSERRGGELRRAEFEDALAVSSSPDPLILAIDDALESLARLDPRKVSIVELTYFGGLTYAEVGEVHGISEATVKRELAMARAWIKANLQKP